MLDTGNTGQTTRLTPDPSIPSSYGKHLWGVVLGFPTGREEIVHVWADDVEFSSQGDLVFTGQIIPGVTGSVFMAARGTWTSFFYINQEDDGAAAVESWET